jgi:hypothetical protein
MTQSLVSNPVADSKKNMKITKDYIQVIKEHGFWKLHFGHLGARFKWWKKYLLIFKSALVFYYFRQWLSNWKIISQVTRINGRITESTFSLDPVAESTKKKKLANNYIQVIKSVHFENFIFNILVRCGGDSSTTISSTCQLVDSVNWSTGLRVDNSSTPSRRQSTRWQGYKFSQLVDWTTHRQLATGQH